MKKQHVLFFWSVILFVSVASHSVVAARWMENLDRGVVAVSKGGKKIYIGWRMFGTDPDTIGFNIYRDSVKINASPITGSTNYADNNGSSSSTYSVAPVIDGIEQEASVPVDVWANQYLDIPLLVPAGVTTPDGVTCTYSPNDASVGDLDGDGQYEIVLKWDPSNSKDNSQSGYTGNVYLDAYELDGTFLWRIDLGINIRAGAHYSQFMVYDFDSDGFAEIACKTADGTVDGLGTVIGDPYADWRNSSGYILNGPEYFTVFDGQTGANLATEDYIVPRGTVSNWGDSYGNRVDRFLACVAYLDGTEPSLVMCRGYYTRTVLAAWDFRNGQLSQRWLFDSYDGTPGNSAYSGQGNHNLSVGDVDNDGKDEIMYGACAIDDDGTGLYSTGYGHGDAMHLSDLDPSRPGLEVFTIHEGSGSGSTFRDAGTGEILWETDPADVGRCVSADIDASYPGAECWGFGGLRSCTGEVISSSSPSSTNFVVLWDEDLLSELLNSNEITKHGGSTLLTASGCSSNNSTKSTPCLSADILGDWREEVIWRTSDNQSLRIYTTTDETTHRIYTLMHDPQYRLSIAWQNTAYNQPPHTGFFMGDGMADLQSPNIILVGTQLLYGDFNSDFYVDTQDLPYFSALWLEDDCGLTAEMDLNEDCIINNYELSVFAGNWTGPDTTPPSAPIGLSATAGNSTISLDWYDRGENDLAGYNVYRSTISGSDYMLLNTSLLTSSDYVDNDVVNGTTYYYVVTALDIGSNESETSSEVSATPISPMLVAHYKLDGNVDDSSGNANHATATGAPVYTTGHTDQAIDLDGTDDFITLPNDVAESDDITIAAWVYWNGGGSWQRIFDFGNNTTEYMFLTPSSGSSNMLRFAITTSSSGGEQFIETSQLAVDQWVHVTVKLEGNTATLYVDGLTAVTNNLVTINPTDFVPVNNYIGQSQWSDPLFDGRVDDFRIYNYALSDAEIRNLATNGDTIQAESASYGGGAVFENTNSGFVGTGYVNFPTSGGYLEFTDIDGGTGGDVSLDIRYALGAAARTGNLIVNGVSQSITFDSTSAWTTWEVKNLTVTLNSGTANTIRFESNGEDLANIDEITVTP